jgi:1-acyl-sn-glycerol-3-phosphate acyltransferase
MIIKARHHSFINPFFRRYSKWQIRKHFHKVIISGDYKEKKLPILLISNHMSWWDGFWLSDLSERVFNRKFHFMMLEDQLKKHWYFQYTGGFSVKKGSRSIIETINYAAELLSHEKNLVMMFPQGEIQSLYTKDFVFEKGIQHILDRVKVPVQIIFVANLIDYFSNKKPSLFTYIKEYSGEPGIAQIQSAYNDFYRSSIENNIKMKEI